MAAPRFELRHTSTPQRDVYVGVQRAGAIPDCTTDAITEHKRHIEEVVSKLDGVQQARFIGNTAFAVTPMRGASLEGIVPEVSKLMQDFLDKLPLQ